MYKMGELRKTERFVSKNNLRTSADCETCVKRQACKGKATRPVITIRPTGGRGQEHSSLALTGRLMVLGASESQGGGSVSIDTVALPWAKMPCPFRAKNTVCAQQIIV